MVVLGEHIVSSRQHGIDTYYSKKDHAFITRVRGTILARIL
jgi:hypothetical protein